MGARRPVRRIFGGDASELFRRYFVNTLFDSTFVVLGIIAAALFSPDPAASVALDVLFFACLAIGISTGVSVYEAEHTEGEIRMRRLESALLSSLRGSDVDINIRHRRYATAFVNFLAPLIVAGITGTPLLLHRMGILGDLTVASLLSGGLGIGIIFAAGYYLGALAGRRPWRKGARMSLVAILTFAGLVLLERIL